MIRVILADDHDLVRTGLKRLLDDVQDIEVIAEAKNGKQAIELVEQNQPEVVLLDINMPELNGIDTTRKLRQTYPNIKILIISMHSDEVFPQRLLKAGANAYLTKDTGLDEIVHAIHTVLSGKNYICNEVAQKVALVNSGNSAGSPLQQLSERELQVLGLIIAGMKVNEISDKLCLSPKTISTYRHRLFTKLNVKNDVELAKLALQHGYMEESPLP